MNTTVSSHLGVMMRFREESSCQVVSPALSAEKALQNWLLTITYYHVPGRLFHALFMLLHYSCFFFFLSSHSHQIQLQRLIQEKTVMLTMCDSWSEKVMDAKLRWAPGAA